MKIIINGCYGGFCLNDEVIKKLSESGIVVDKFGAGNSTRTNPELIKMIENGEDVNAEYSYLEVVNIPDNATDYLIEEHDGNERILCVINGKIHKIY